MKTTEETAAYAGKLALGLIESDNPVSAGRRHRICAIQEKLESHPLPWDAETYCQFALVPFIFQEANYDGMDWTTQGAPLDQLADFFELDSLIANGGRERNELTPEEFNVYIQLIFTALHRIGS